MNAPGAPEISIETLMAQIREEVARRRETSPPGTQGAVVDNRPIPSASAVNPTSKPEATSSQKVPGTAVRPDRPERQSDTASRSANKGGRIFKSGDFSKLQDAAFVNAAYWAVLNRAPDADGEQHYLRLLRSGASRAEILGRLRYSPEGNTIGVRIDGLTHAEKAPRAAPEGSRNSRLSDFSGLHDAAFIGAAYQVVLKRRPDPNGEECYLEILRNGATKAEILGQLRYSPEGRAIGVTVEGLARAVFLDKLTRLPVVGRLFRALSAFWTLPDSERRIRAIANDLARIAAQGDRRAELAHQASHDALRDVSARVSELANGLAARATREDATLIRRSITELRELVATDKVNRQELTLLRDDLTATFETWANREQFNVLAARLETLDAALAGLRQSKMDVSRLDQVRAEARTALHRGVDDVNRTFRMLLDSKADQAALADARSDLQAAVESGIARAMQAIGAVEAQKLDAEDLEVIRKEIGAALRDDRSALEAAFESRLASVMQVIQSIDAQKLDAEGLEAIRKEIDAALRDGRSALEAAFESRLASVMQDAQKVDAASERAIGEQFRGALRAGLEGVTASIAALAASKVDRATVNSLLADYSEVILKQMREMVRNARLPMAETDQNPVEVTDANKNASRSPPKGVVDFGTSNPSIERRGQTGVGAELMRSRRSKSGSQRSRQVKS